MAGFYLVPSTQQIGENNSKCDRGCLTCGETPLTQRLFPGSEVAKAVKAKKDAGPPEHERWVGGGGGEGMVWWIPRNFAEGKQHGRFCRGCGEPDCIARVSSFQRFQRVCQKKEKNMKISCRACGMRRFGEVDADAFKLGTYVTEEMDFLWSEAIWGLQSPIWL